MKDIVSWPPRSNGRFGIWKHLFNPIWVTEALNRVGSFFTKTIVFFYQIKDNISWPPRSNDNFSTCEHLLNTKCITEELNRPNNGPNMVLNCKFSQPYIKYPVQAWASVDGFLNRFWIGFKYKFWIDLRTNFQ